jgi:hypothetical protein
MLLILAPIVGSAAGIYAYGVATDWYFLLPGLPSHERFGQDSALAFPLADRIEVPRPPDFKGASAEEIRAFYEAYHQLRRNPRDPRIVEQLAQTFDRYGHSEKAAAAYKRAKALR